MNILLLPGNSPENKDWIDGFGSFCKGKFDIVKVVHYDHWDSGEQFADIEKEAQKGERIVNGWRDYIIVSKSIGCAVTLKMLKNLKVQPKYVVMIGFPLLLLENKYKKVLDLLNNIQIRLIFVQKPKDPASSFVGLKAFLEGLELKNYKAMEYTSLEEPIDNHHYGSYEKLVLIIKNAPGGN